MENTAERYETILHSCKKQNKTTIINVSVNFLPFKINKALEGVRLPPPSLFDLAVPSNS